MNSRTVRASLLASCALVGLLGAAPICGSAADDSAKGFTPAAETTAASAEAAPATASGGIPTPGHPLSPPVAPTDDMVFGAEIMSTRDRPAGGKGEVLAFIDGQRCGQGTVFNHVSEPPSSTLTIRVASDASQPGCGRTGSLVKIEVDGQPMNKEIEWKPGGQPNALFIIGPAFARYHGELKVDSGIAPDMRVVPYIEGQACGHQYIAPMLWDDGDWFYYVMVESDEQRSGCGRPGAVVSFVLEIDGQPSVDLGTEPWQGISTDEWDPFDPPAIIERSAITVCGMITMTPVEGHPEPPACPF